jgi:hypothetical protein
MLEIGVNGPIEAPPHRLGIGLVHEKSDPMA